MKVIKNFLKKEDFENIKNYITHPNTPWYYQPKILTYSKKSERGYFSHALFHENKINSEGFETMVPLLKKLKANTLVNIRANLNIKSDEQYTSGFHTDYDYEKCLTAIYYINKCNGYTEFDNIKKTKVYCETNKIVVFDCKIKHRMVSQTDDNRRMVININFIK